MLKEHAYLKNRWQHRLIQHREQATQYRRLHVQLVLGMSSGWVLLLILLAAPEIPRLSVLLIAALTGGAMLVHLLLRPGQRWRQHENRADALERERALYEARIGPYAGDDAFTRFVARCENLPQPEAASTSAPPLPPRPSFRPQPYRPFGSSGTPGRFGRSSSQLDNDDLFDDDDDDDNISFDDDDESVIGRLPFRRQPNTPPTTPPGDAYRDEQLPRHSANGGPTFCFTTYYPAEVMPNQWQRVVAYAYPRIAEDAIIADAAGRQPPPAPAYSRPQRSIPEGARVTVIPHMDGFQFNPASVTLSYYRTWHRFAFEMRATAAPADTAVNGTLSFLVEGVVVADVPLAVFVGAASVSATLRRATRTAYGSMLACYSDADQQVNSALDRVCRALEIDCHRADISADEAVRTAVAQADVLQVFWSQAAAHDLPSAPESNGRPLHVVYWQQPCPPLPDWLQHVQPVFEPVLADTGH